jgi:hypothetical protein
MNEQVINVSTGEVTIIKLNPEIIAERKVKFEAEKLAKSEAAAARAALLDKLGITEEEAKLLLS